MVNLLKQTLNWIQFNQNSFLTKMQVDIKFPTTGILPVSEGGVDGHCET